jgi:hypothetical protein
MVWLLHIAAPNKEYWRLSFMAWRTSGEASSEAWLPSWRFWLPD